MPRFAAIKIDADLCMGCFECLYVCPVNALHPVSSSNGRCVQVAGLNRTVRCMGCGECIDICQQGAITGIKSIRYKESA